MKTYTGKYINLLLPKAEDIVIEDIAHALAHICRFNGHCTRHYSVAQHSVLVAEAVMDACPDAPPMLALAALLHDAPEAYCGDIGRNLKRLIGGYDGVYHEFERLIFEKYGVSYDAVDWGLIWQIDDRICVDEGLVCMNNQPGEWTTELGQPLGVTVDLTQSADWWEGVFLGMFDVLTLRLRGTKDAR